MNLSEGLSGNKKKNYKLTEKRLYIYADDFYCTKFYETSDCFDQVMAFTIHDIA